MKNTPNGPPNSYPCLLFDGFISVVVRSASFSSAISFFVTDRVTRNVVTLELSDVTVAVVVVEDSSTFLSGVRPRLGDRRLGVTVVCCVTCSCCTGGSFDTFGDGGRRRLRAGDRDRERDLRLPGDIDLFRTGLRDGEAERERKDRVSFCNTKPRNVRVGYDLLRFNYDFIYISLSDRSSCKNINLSSINRVDVTGLV